MGIGLASDSTLFALELSNCFEVFSDEASLSFSNDSFDFVNHDDPITFDFENFDWALHLDSAYTARSLYLLQTRNHSFSPQTCWVQGFWT